MIKQRIDECTACPGRLEKKGKYWVCRNCGAIYSVTSDYDGKEFTFPVAPPKELPCGQMGERAVQISVNKITVKEIKPIQSIESEVYRESIELDHHENIKLITIFLKNGEWEAAQGRICELRNLKDPCSLAMAAWYDIACERRAHNDLELVRSFTNISDAEIEKIDAVFPCAAPDFRRRVLDLLLSSTYLSDESTIKIFSTIMPYVFNKTIYSPQECREKVEVAFEKVISHGYHQTFKYLLNYTLENHEVDRYITYLEQFAENCTPQEAQEYYSMIIDIDPGNASAHHSLVEADIEANSTADKCITDFEKLIMYSQNPKADVKKFITILINEKITTESKANFMWSLMGYYHEDEEKQKQAMFQYADLLLQSKLWNRASDYYSTVLSKDTRNARVYFRLFLADVQVRNGNELIEKNEVFITHPYYTKALAIADESFTEYLEGLTISQNKRLKDEENRRENKKRILKKTISAFAVVIFVLGITIGLIGFNNNRKYGENNIDLTVKDKGYPADADSSVGCHFILDVNIENGSSLTINRIDGIMRYYNSDGKLLHESYVWLTGTLESGKDYNYELEIKQDATAETIELYTTSLASLEITWELTEVTFKDNNVKEYNSGKEHVIHNIGDSAIGQSSQEKEDLATKNKIDDSLKVFEKGEDNANGFSVEVGEARDTILSLLGNNCAGDFYGKHFETVYVAAQAYEEKGFYGKAYWLYDVLGYYGYEECSAMADRCSDKWFLKSSLISIAEQDDNDPNLRIYITANLDIITGLYVTSDWAEPIKQIVYDETMKFKQKGQYHKAYYLFKDLYYSGYQAAGVQMEECRKLINN